MDTISCSRELTWDLCHLAATEITVTLHFIIYSSNINIIIIQCNKLLNQNLRLIIDCIYYASNCVIIIKDETLLFTFVVVVPYSRRYGMILSYKVLPGGNYRRVYVYDYTK